jgi:hypothetical protein
VITYRVTLDVPVQLVPTVSNLLKRYREELGTGNGTPRPDLLAAVTAGRVRHLPDPYPEPIIAPEVEHLYSVSVAIATETRYVFAKRSYAAS